MLKMDAKEFLDYVSRSKAKNTVKSYRNGIRHFCRWYKNDFSVECLSGILEERKRSLESEDARERKKFELLVEEWHRTQLNTGVSVNSARNRYVAVCQFFKFFDLDLKTSIIPSEVKKTVISERYYVLTVEDVKAMYQVANLRGRTILLMAKDLGLRLSDFRTIKVKQLPNLDAEPPIPFNIETRKEHVWTKGFLSTETAQTLRTYVETLKKRERSSPYLWPSNEKHPLDQDSFGIWLKKLAVRAGIKTANQSLTFHCFRRLLMRAAIETGVGLTAAKLMVGKAVMKSDETYIAKARLRDAFTKLSKYLNVTRVEAPSQPELAKTIVNQQHEIADLKETVSDLTKRLDVIEKEMDRLRIRHQYQYKSIPTARKLTDKEVDEILENEKKIIKELKKHGFTTKPE